MLKYYGRNQQGLIIFRFAGVWSLLNICILSGFSASASDARRLGALLPLAGDHKRSRLFTLHYTVVHASQVQEVDQSGIFA